MESPLSNEVSGAGRTAKWWEACLTPTSIISAMVITGGFLYLFFGPKEDRAAVLTLMTTVATYWCGSSEGSRIKDRVMAAAKTVKAAIMG